MLESDYYCCLSKCEANGIRDHKYALSLLHPTYTCYTVSLMDIFVKKFHEGMIQCLDTVDATVSQKWPLPVSRGSLYEAQPISLSHSTPDCSKAPCVNVDSSSTCSCCGRRFPQLTSHWESEIMSNPSLNFLLQHFPGQGLQVLGSVGE